MHTFFISIKRENSNYFATFVLDSMLSDTLIRHWDYPDQSRMHRSKRSLSLKPTSFYIKFLVLIFLVFVFIPIVLYLKVLPTNKKFSVFTFFSIRFG